MLYLHLFPNPELSGQGSWLSGRASRCRWRSGSIRKKMPSSIDPLDIAAEKTSHTTKRKVPLTKYNPGKLRFDLKFYLDVANHILHYISLWQPLLVSLECFSFTEHSKYTLSTMPKAFSAHHQLLAFCDAVYNSEIASFAANAMMDFLWSGCKRHCNWVCYLHSHPQPVIEHSAPYVHRSAPYFRS